MTRSARQASRTLLIVGEGDTDVAFLTHIKALYAPRYCGLAVTLRNARGKGPENVVHAVMGYSRDRNYTLRAALLDTDLPWPQKICKIAKQKRISMLGSNPCLEGLLLDVLGKPVPDHSSKCKRTLRRIFHDDPLQPGSYAGRFPKDVLEAARGRVATLHELLELFP